MRQAFAHDAEVTLEAGGDVRALGAAITVGLCGHWEHEPPCPLAPHHTDAQRSGDTVRVRVLFACEPPAEVNVRARIVAALGSRELRGPDGATTRWRVDASRSGLVRDDEEAHAQRLIGSVCQTA
jgi:hypothetical protein